MRNMRDQPQQQDGQPPQGQQGKPPIVARIAELRALKRRQESVSRALDVLKREGLPDDPAQLTPLQRSRIERLAHEQGAIRTMWRDLAKSLGVPEEAFEQAPPEAGPKVPPPGPPKEEGR
jgi:hypothetical protein